MKLSLILAVHNEALFLPYLDAVLHYVDEAIIVDSSPFGPSDDGSTEILADYARRYPYLKLTVIKDNYRRNDGIKDYAWDESKINNFMINTSSGDFLLFHHADIIYDAVDLEKTRKAIDTFSNKLIFYTDYLEFMWDTYHIHLRPDSMETAFFRPPTGYAFVVSRKANPTWRNYPLGLQLGHELNMTVALFCPHIRRWHFALCKPYPLRVVHVCRQIATGDLQGFADKGATECFNGAISEAENMRGQGFEYCGDYPEIMQGWRPSCADGRDEFYQNRNFYQDKLAKYFSEEVQK